MGIVDRVFGYYAPMDRLACEVSKARPMFCVAIVLLCCAPTPRQAMTELHAVAPDSIASSYRDALRRSRAVQLTTGQRLTGQLSQGDPVLMARPNSTGVLRTMEEAMVQADSTPPDELDDFLRSLGFDGESDVGGIRGTPRSTVRSDSIWAASMDSLGDALRSYYRTPFRTYYDVYAVHVDTFGGYELTVDAVCCEGFRSTVVRPVVVLLDAGGTPLRRYAKAQYLHETKVVLAGEIAPGEYFVLVGADNSRPDATVGWTVSSSYEIPSYDPASGRLGSGIPVPGSIIELKATAEGSYTIGLVVLEQ